MKSSLSLLAKKQLSIGLILVATAFGIFGKKGTVNLNEQTANENTGVSSQTQSTTLLSGPGNGFSGPSLASAVAPVGHSKIPEQVLPFRRELETLSGLRSKVLLEPSDVELQKSLYSNRAFLASLTSFLAKPSNKDPQLARQQNEVLDFLYNGLNSQSKAQCLEVLMTIVSDNSIEQASSLAPEQKESLAGIKGEALYHLSATLPETRAQIEKSLPGPMSQKIWANVIDVQRANLAESQLELPQ